MYCEIIKIEIILKQPNGDSRVKYNNWNLKFTRGSQLVEERINYLEDWEILCKPKNKREKNGEKINKTSENFGTSLNAQTYM